MGTTIDCRPIVSNNVSLIRLNTLQAECFRIYASHWEAVSKNKQMEGSIVDSAIGITRLLTRV